LPERPRHFNIYLRRIIGNDRMPSKKKGSKPDEREMQKADFEDLIEEFDQEEQKVVQLMEGFANLLDDIYKDGLSFYDVALAQRVVNAFLLDFMEEMYDGEMDELIDEIIKLNEKKVPSKPATKPKKAKKAKKAKK
jgi:flagellar motor component MotA